MTAPRLDDILSQDDWLRRMARAIVHDPALADDVTQDAWVVALREGRGGPENRPWLLGVLHHSARSIFRRESAIRSRQGRSESSIRADGAEGLSTVDVVADLDLRRRIAEKLIELEEPFRTALHLRYVVGESLPSLARSTGVSTSTAASRCERGLAKLRYAMADGADAGSGGTPWVQALMLAAGPPKVAAVGAQALMVLVAAGLLGVVGWVGWSLPRAAESPGRSEVPVIVPEVGAAVAELAGQGSSTELVAIAPRQKARQVAPASPEVSSAQAMTVIQEDPPEPSAPQATTITARILEPSERPASGTWRLKAWPGSSSHMNKEEIERGSFTMEGTLDSEGSLEMTFERLHGFQYALQVTGPEGGELSWRWVHHQLKGSTDLGSATLSPVGRLEGRVRLVNGEPPTRGRLWTVAARWEDDRPGFSGGIRHVAMDPTTGQFVFDGLPCGVIRLEAWGEHYGASDKISVDLRDTGRGPAEIVLHDFEDREGRVYVTLSQDRRIGFHDPDAGFLKLLVDDTEIPALEVAGRAHLFEFVDIPSGELTLRMDDPSFRTIEKPGIQRGRRYTLKVVGSARIRPVVTGPDGVTKADYRLEAMPLLEPQVSRNRTVLRSKREGLTDGLVTGLTDGSYRLYVEASGARGIVDVRDLAPGEERRVEVQLHRMPVVRGILMGTDGTALPNQLVRLVLPAERSGGVTRRIAVQRLMTTHPGVLRWEMARCQSDELGRFELPVEEPGRFLVIVGEPPGPSVETPPMDFGVDSEDVDLQLVLPLGGYVEATVHAPGGLSLDGWEVVTHGQRSTERFLGRIDKEGRVRMGPIPAGEHELYLRQPGEPNLSNLFVDERGRRVPMTTVTVSDGKTLEIELTAPGPPLATVDVELEVDLSVGGHRQVHLVSFDRSGECWFSSPSNATGKHRVYARPGSYRLAVNGHSSHWIDGAEFALAEGEVRRFSPEAKTWSRSLEVVGKKGAGMDFMIQVEAIIPVGFVEMRRIHATVVRPEPDGSVILELGRGQYALTLTSPGDRTDPEEVVIRWPLPEGQTELRFER